MKTANPLRQLKFRAMEMSHDEINMLNGVQQVKKHQKGRLF